MPFVALFNRQQRRFLFLQKSPMMIHKKDGFVKYLFAVIGPKRERGEGERGGGRERGGRERDLIQILKKLNHFLIYRVNLDYLWLLLRPTNIKNR